MTFVKKGVVIPLGAGGEIDSGNAFHVSAIVINGKIWLYYSTDDGVNYRTALAISEDGLNFVKKGVILPIGAGGAIDDEQAFKPSVLVINDTVYLYYTAYDGVNTRTALAISDDGLNFVKKGIVIPLGGAGEIDEYLAIHMSAIVINDKIYLYYSIVKDGDYRIALAISEDGLNFVKKGIVLDVQPGIDYYRAFKPSAIVINDKIYLYYAAFDDLKMRTALAISEDGLNFVKKGVVIPLGGVGDIDEVGAFNPSVVVINDKIYLYYTADDGVNYRVALAISEDGM